MSEGATSASASATRTVVREVVSCLDNAKDEALARVVAIVDALPIRGAADALIAPMRPRLALLRPARPLSFARLLFTPLDPVIVTPSGWRRGKLGIPRTIIVPIAMQVRRELADTATAIEASLVGCTTNDRHAILQAGEILWRAAAELLARLPMPSDWPSVTGLSEADHAVLARACTIVLTPAATTERIIAGLCDGEAPDAATLREILVGTVSAGPLEVSTLLAVLLTRIPNGAQLVTAAMELTSGQPDAQRSAVVDHAIEFILDGIEAFAGSDPDLDRTIAAGCRIAAMLQFLEQPGPAFRPSRKARIDAMRRDIDDNYRARFAAELDRRVARVSEALGPSATDAEVENLERTIRDLRRLETAGRRLGGAEHYDRKLRQATAQMRASGLPLMDRVRLVEIMEGPKAALALLASG